MNLKKALFGLLFVASFTPWVSGPLALTLGVVFALTLGNPFAGPQLKKTQTYLLQGSVVGLGFAMNFQAVLKSGADSVFMTLSGLVIVFGLGFALSRAFKLSRNLGILLSAGTAICGGSAIAAVGPTLNAKDEEMTVSLAVVFLLNALGLLLFPTLGHLLGLSETAFGTWAALAIHDTSSVVGASNQYGPTALQIATTTKLVRALWIAPVTLLIAAFIKRDRKSNKSLAGVKRPSLIPTFLYGFLAASILGSFIHELSVISVVAKQSLVATLFLIGSGLSLKAIREVGASALVMATLLWLLVSAMSLVYVRGFVS